MIGIDSISYVIPERRVSTLARLDELNTTESVVRNRIGVFQVARKADGEETSDLCLAAAAKLFATGRVSPELVDCLVVVTQNPDGHGLPATASVVHGRLDLPTRCAAFDLSLGCSGFVYGLSVVQSFMESNGLDTGLLVTADPYSKVVDKHDRKTALLFGDAAAVTLLSRAPRWRIGRFDFGSRGELRDTLCVREDGLLFMNGRAVFQFSAKEVPDSIRRTLALNGLTLDSIDRFVLHQGSKAIIDAVGKRLGIEDRTGFTAESFGNTVSSSVPIAFARDVKAEDRRVVVSGFGVGLSWATTVLERV